MLPALWWVRDVVLGFALGMPEAPALLRPSRLAQDVNKELCGGGFSLRMKIRLEGAEVDVFLAATADDLCNKLKTEWGWHWDRKGEI